MCDHATNQPLAEHLGKLSHTVEATPSTGSRRRRLWNLPHRCHCPVIGVCLPIDVLKRIVTKAVGKEVLVEDYVVHTSVVSECRLRGHLTEMLQAELERRFSKTINKFKAAKTIEELALLWKQVFESGDVAGALWAGLTHPRCDEHMDELIYSNIHMYQHYAVEMLQADSTNLELLFKENAVLTKELGKVQERSTRMLADRNSEIKRLNAQLMQLRAESLAKDSRLAFLSEDMGALKASIPGLDAAILLQKKVEQMTARQAELERQNRELRQKLASATKSLDVLSGESSSQLKTDAAARMEPGVSPVTVYLQQKTVLCVGGRSGSIANYRDLVERVGGRFAHHDGGLEDSQSVLDASLVAADLVICQTGCISHNAYWKVKDFCKRTGKRCVFVENPSASSLVRGLEQISDHDTGLIQEHNAAALQVDFKPQTEFDTASFNPIGEQYGKRKKTSCN